MKKLDIFEQCFSLQSFLAADSTLRDHTRALTSSSSCMSGLAGNPEMVVLGPGIFRQLNHPVFTSLHLQQCIVESEVGISTESMS